MTICQVCQKENPAGAEYCEDCGAALSVAAPVGAGVASRGAGVSEAATSAAPSSAQAPVVPDVQTEPPSTSSSAAAPGTPQAPEAPAPSAPRGGSEAQARLIAVRYGAPTGDEIPLFGQRLVVGRFDPETGPVDIDLSEGAEAGHISRQHGELYREADSSWSVRDLGSTNGVFVKSGEDASFGPRITEPKPLRDGDEVAFGNARFIFRSA
jgi:pSer/pThr/pTyr-binding forkhead associated (FHA) protein